MTYTSVQKWRTNRKPDREEASVVSNEESDPDDGHLTVPSLHFSDSVSFRIQVWQLFLQLQNKLIIAHELGATPVCLYEIRIANFSPDVDDLYFWSLLLRHNA